MNGLKRRARKFIAQFDMVDWYRVRIIPKGSDDPLPAIPDVVEITPEDVDEAIRDWNKTMPDYAGMLEAEVINKRDFDNG